MAPEASGSSSLASLSQALPLAPSSSFFSMMPTPPLYLQIPHSNSSTKLSLFSETLPTPFSSALVRTCLFKMKSSEDPEAKPLISYTTWAKAEMQAIVKNLPKVTKGPHRFAEEFNLHIQIYQPDFSNLYHLVHMLSMKPGPALDKISKLEKS